MHLYYFRVSECQIYDLSSKISKLKQGKLIIMNFNFNSLCDQFVFWHLKKIVHGYLELIDSQGKKYYFAWINFSNRWNNVWHDVTTPRSS